MYDQNLLLHKLTIDLAREYQEDRLRKRINPLRNPSATIATTLVVLVAAVYVIGISNI